MHLPRPSTGSSSSRARPGLLTRFGILSLVVVVALGLVVGVVLQRSLRDRTMADAVRSAEIAARVGITPHVSAEDLQRDFVPLTSERLAEIDERLGAAVSENGIVRLKIWNARHWIVYSDNDRLVGRWFASDPLLFRSLRGETVSTVTDLSRPEELEEREFGRLLAVYVPLRASTEDGSSALSGGQDGGEVVGAFEVYLPYAPIAAQIESGTRQLWLTLGVGLVVLYLVLFRLVAGASRLLRRQSADNERLARTDGLTGLANRFAFREQVEGLLPGHRVVVALAGLDRFQDVNDTLGHGAGDEMLVMMARRLAELDAVVARTGGDEFAVAVVATGDDLPAAVQALHGALSRSVVVGGVTIESGCSVGVAVGTGGEVDVDELLRRADVAMRHAKRSPGSIRPFDASIDVHTPEQLALVADVRTAIRSGQLFLVYQPKMEIATGRVRGVEALVRWRHPERGIVPPGEFLPVVERTELIRPLTMAVIEQALDQAVIWRDRGLDLCVAVNLSARVLEDTGIVAALGRELAVRDLDPSSIEVELTESAMASDSGALADVLGRLDDLGVPIAIDDFGTGFASVSYVAGLPVDVLKIDREFVDDVRTNPRHEAVVQFTASLGRAFGMTVVAEGVEDLADLPVLARLGVDQIQGYGLARPMDAADVPTWWEQHHRTWMPPVALVDADADDAGVADLSEVPS